jgi:tRNA uridine 5-carboxymethylaminomethyl modification enzyme
MFTSRAEQRLKLRIDNADDRLNGIGYEAGLLSEERREQYRQKLERKGELLNWLRSSTATSRSAGYEQFSAQTGVELTEGANLGQLARRPEIEAEALLHLIPASLGARIEELRTVVTDLKYEGYLSAQEGLQSRLARAAGRPIPQHIAYAQLPGLSHEMAERLERVRPTTLGQDRIPGLTPAAPRY